VVFILQLYGELQMTTLYAPFKDTATGINTIYNTLELMKPQGGLRTQLMIEMGQLTQTINEQLIQQINDLEATIEIITEKKEKV
jgi:hypothetical protein